MGCNLSLGLPEHFSDVILGSGVSLNVSSCEGMTGRVEFKGNMLGARGFHPWCNESASYACKEAQKWNGQLPGQRLTEGRKEGRMLGTLK